MDFTLIRGHGEENVISGEIPPQSKQAVLSPLAATLEVARRGRKEILGQLRQYLDENEEIWRDNGDLARLLEQAWIDRIAGTNLLASESLRRTVEHMRRDLTGAEP